VWFRDQALLQRGPLQLVVSDACGQTPLIACSTFQCFLLTITQITATKQQFNKCLPVCCNSAKQCRQALVELLFSSCDCKHDCTLHCCSMSQSITLSSETKNVETWLQSTFCNAATVHSRLQHILRPVH